MIQAVSGPVMKIAPATLAAGHFFKAADLAGFQ